MEELLATVDDIVKKVNFTEKELKLAEKTLSQLRDAISVAQQRVDEARQGDLVSALRFAREQTLERAPEIYSDKVLEAVTRNDEFAYPAFLNPLLEIANDESLFSINITGGGWAARAQVTINMNEVAGDIEDYANAVQTVRDDLGVGQGEDARKASHLWRTRIYPTRGGLGPYAKTISRRLSAATSPAPYWSLLNDGNKISMSSDRGGMAYPNKAGTHFVQEAEKAIRDEFSFIMGGYKDSNSKYITDLMLMIGHARGAILSLMQKIESIQLEPEKMDYIAKQIGVEREKISSLKIVKAKSKLESGEYLPEQISIQGPGEKRKRIRRKKFVALLSNID